MTEISKEKLLETSFYHPNLCIAGLMYLPWKSKQREIIEKIFRHLLKINPLIIHKLNKHSRVTFNTLKVIIDVTPPWENSTTVFTLASVLEALSESVNQFVKDDIQPTEEDYPYIDKFIHRVQNIINYAEKHPYMNEFFLTSAIAHNIITLSQFLPDTPLWDPIRTIIQNIIYQNDYIVNVPISYEVLKWASANVKSINDKIFRTFMSPEPIASKIRNQITNPPELFDLYTKQLQFAIHNETEFLECWNKASTRIRRSLASFYSHISPTLLETFLKKYSQTKFVDIFLKHPKIPESYIIFYATQQNPIALKLIEEKQQQT